MSLHSNQGNTNSSKTEMNYSDARLAHTGNSDITKMLERMWNTVEGCKLL